MSHELQSEAIDLIVSQLDKQRGNYEVRLCRLLCCAVLCCVVVCCVPFAPVYLICFVHGAMVRTGCRKASKRANGQAIWTHLALRNRGGFFVRYDTSNT